jgi:CheY-like chemotaxis protein
MILYPNGLIHNWGKYPSQYRECTAWIAPGPAPSVVHMNNSPIATLSVLVQSPAMLPRPACRKRVLVIDNEPASTRLVRLTLEKHAAFEVCEINDPTRAVASALEFEPDLILLDIEMPGMDGGAVARNLHAHSSLRCPPIVFMTSLVTEDEAAHPMFTAGSRVLAKPVTVPKLLRTVAELLSAAIAEHPPAPASAAASRDLRNRRADRVS